MPRKSKKSLAATKREKKKAEGRLINQLNAQVLSHNDLETDHEDREGYQSDNTVFKESAGGGNRTGFESDADETQVVKIDGNKETPYEHFYRNQLNENHVGKRAHAESDPVAATPGDTASVESGVDSIPATKK
ncbi:hypothetical protein FRC09_010539, partial [Ceratobasidium sp. 395]